VPWTPGGPLPDLDFGVLFRALHEHGVRYVVIGGAALNLLGVGLLTEDVDICYEPSEANTRALARALRSLGAVPVDADLRPLPVVVDPRALQFHDNFLYVTAAGRLDCLRVPDGTTGYDDLIRTAREHEVHGVPVVVPSYEDMRRMKLATNRPKDRLGLEELGALMDVADDVPPPPFNPSPPAAAHSGIVGPPPAAGPGAPAARAAGAGAGWILVREHRRADGTLVREHYRRTPAPADDHPVETHGQGSGRPHPAQSRAAAGPRPGPGARRPRPSG